MSDLRWPTLQTALVHGLAFTGPSDQKAHSAQMLAFLDRACTHLIGSDVITKEHMQAAQLLAYATLQGITLEEKFMVDLAQNTSTFLCDAKKMGRFMPLMKHATDKQPDWQTWYTGLAAASFRKQAYCQTLPPFVPLSVLRAKHDVSRLALLYASLPFQCLLRLKIWLREVVSTHDIFREIHAYLQTQHIVLIAGPQGAGKTSVYRALGCIPSQSRDINVTSVSTNIHILDMPSYTNELTSALMTTAHQILLVADIMTCNSRDALEAYKLLSRPHMPVTVLLNQADVLYCRLVKDRQQEAVMPVTEGMSLDAMLMACDPPLTEEMYETANMRLLTRFQALQKEIRDYVHELNDADFYLVSAQPSFMSGVDSKHANIVKKVDIATLVKTKWPSE